jgi:hypothetical protein
MRRYLPVYGPALLPLVIHNRAMGAPAPTIHREVPTLDALRAMPSAECKDGMLVTVTEDGTLRRFDATADGGPIGGAA